MIAVPPGVRILLAARPVDFRKGMDGLAARHWAIVASLVATARLNGVEPQSPSGRITSDLRLLRAGGA